jgi:hypothetical protein
MIYLTGASNPTTRTMAAQRTDLGLMCQPGSGYISHIPDYPVFAADNGCFADRWKPDIWLRYLDRVALWQERCLFVVVPDRYCDHAATLELWDRWAGEVIDRDLSAAFVCQNDCTPDDIPNDANAVFIGGDTTWKLSRWAGANIAASKARGRWAHVGRVNTAVRWGSVRIMGADSADGTLIKHGPRPETVRQLVAMLDQPAQLEFVP